MLKLLLGTLLVGLVIGCAMEEQESSGVLVDSSQEVEVPDWVTAAYLDLNKDGTVDLLDLVIHSKFFGQDVSEADTVTNNYLYAVIELHKGYTYSDHEYISKNLSQLNEAPLYAKFAFRFSIEKSDDGINKIKEIKVKPIDKNPLLKSEFSQNILSHYRSSELKDWHSTRNHYDPYGDKVEKFKIEPVEVEGDFGEIDIQVHYIGRFYSEYFDSHRKSGIIRKDMFTYIISAMDGINKEEKEQALWIKKDNMDEGFIWHISIRVKDPRTDNDFLFFGYKWRSYHNIVFDHNRGEYVRNENALSKMSSQEIRAEYFPEDIEE